MRGKPEKAENCFVLLSDRFACPQKDASSGQGNKRGKNKRGYENDFPHPKMKLRNESIGSYLRNKVE